MMTIAHFHTIFGAYMCIIVIVVTLRRLEEFLIVTDLGNELFSTVLPV